MDFQKYLTAGETHISNLILEKYRQLEMTNQELLVYLQLLMYRSEIKEFPDFSKISQNLQIPVDALYQIIDSLCQKEIITLKTHTTSDGKKSDYYDLFSIYNKLEKLDMLVFSKEQDKLRLLLTKLEQLLGRVLSPNEIEQARNWLEQDGYESDLIELAFREAMINQINLPFKYVNRILQNWDKKNITTIEEATQEIYNHRKQNQVKKQSIRVPLNHRGN